MVTHGRHGSVSVIIPCYNYGHFLQDALISLQQQDYPAWECWVIDDGSTDPTAEVVKAAAAADSRIHYVYQTNQGQPAARNHGLRRASGNYIQFLDADDVLEPSKFSRQLAWLEDHPGTDIVYGEVRYFRARDTRDLFLNRWDDAMKDWMPKVSGQGLTILTALVENNILELGCALFKKSIVDKTGSFNAQLQGVEDYDYCLRAAMAGARFDFLEEPATNVLMRHHETSYSKNLFFMYKKELMLRSLLGRQLRDASPLARLNTDRYDVRLRRLQDLLIDQVRKGIRRHLKKEEIQWLWKHADRKQKLYFFPRIIKAICYHLVNATFNKLN